MSSHYEERLEQDLRKINRNVSDIAESIDRALHNAFKALKTLDQTLAYRTILEDNPINRHSEEIDRLCHYFVARHLPSAGHLRFISSVMRMNIGLERIGDYAVTICRETVQLRQPLSPTLSKVAEKMAQDTFKMLTEAINAFMQKDAERARATMVYAEQVDRTFATGFDELVRDDSGAKYSNRDLFGILVIFSNLERVSDQAKNICEETVFAVTGQTKKRKVLNILFLDEDTTFGRLAAAFARKAFPKSGRFTCAAQKVGEQAPPAVYRFLREHGHDPEEEKPRPIDWVKNELDKYHLVVSLQGPVSRFLPKLPFHTAALEWKLAPITNLEESAELEATYKNLAVLIRDLMELMRGEEAT